MMTANDKRKYFAEFKHHPLIVAGMLLKCSVCGVLVALLVVIGRQAPDSTFDSGRLVAQLSAQPVPQSFYVK